jgi:hypothetical protein
MMNYARSTTLDAATGLGVDELDYLRRPLLLHAMYPSLEVLS